MNENVRYPAVAESFYPSDRGELDTFLESILSESTATNNSEKASIRALLVPHAGYAFSGRASAEAYSRLAGNQYRTVFILGNAHAYRFNGIALDTHHIWQSPLGRIPINMDAAEQFRTAAPRLIDYLDIAHHSDHVLEVQLPFLQKTLKTGFSILPILFGENAKDISLKTARILSDILQPDDLLIASSDLSHYPSYDDANAIDRKTLDAIVNIDMKGLERHVRNTMKQNVAHEDALFCGPDGLKTLLRIATQRGWTAEELAYCNSGDAEWRDRDAVVGYGSVAFYEPQ
ncbi:MAG: AmmeMemoRadiSam system protein B [Prosthecochloris sp.]|uniref:AmmeMemoRadiSam system protein B n=1 Tax=Prosthecochloris sp. TaxID=290513 RepID=UPI00258B7911|nr:AmmeMemoRadiSam system protein B [Prosthecochloris sp.]MCW8797796.1 AmmeMemoRadiSam system protein B [Prosthecochloris sp.]